MTAAAPRASYIALGVSLGYMAFDLAVMLLKSKSCIATMKPTMYKMMVGKSASSAAGVVDGAVSSVVAGAGAGAGAGASLLGVSHEGVDTMIFCFLNSEIKELSKSSIMLRVNQHFYQYLY